MQNGYENRNKEELISTIYELKNKYEDIRFQYEELRRLDYGSKSLIFFTGYARRYFHRAQQNGFTSRSLQVPRKLYIIAALLAPSCDPANR